MTPEERIKEQRTLEATRNGYMGLGGKFGTILHYLGKPVMGHGTPLFEMTYFESPYYDEEEEEIGYFEEDETVAEVGRIFDGLSRGMHVEIKYFDSLLTVSYKGYTVYAERAGELERYVPLKEWENQIDRLYEIAVKVQREDRKDIKDNNDKIKEAKHKAWLLNILKKWGIKL